MLSDFNPYSVRFENGLVVVNFDVAITHEPYALSAKELHSYIV